jgi:bifunctional oligoribonuclease and PAP phosphatase NrnA
MTTSQIQELKLLLAQPKQIVIVTHKNPDGDAMGSSLGLYNVLIQQSHTVTVITPNERPEFLSWLPGNNVVVEFTANEVKAKTAVAAAAIIFCLDFNTLTRIEELGTAVEKSTAVKILIDHHPQPAAFPDFLLHDVAASSTCQLIYELMELLGEKQLLNKAVATCLYTGIMTDTGSFRFPCTSAKTHLAIAALIEAGAPNALIHQNVYDQGTENRLRLWGYCQSEKMNILYDYNAAYIAVKTTELERFQYKKGDTEGMVNLPLSISGIKFSAFFMESEEKIRISFRSKGNFDVNQFARDHFNGGGHQNAAGGSFSGTLEELVTQFLTLLPLYKEQLMSKNE